MSEHQEFMKEAVAEAKLGLAEGGIPIGSALVIDGKIVGRGHNRRVQKGSAILHAEMDCLENAGRLNAKEYQRSTLYSTLSPCDMCSGAALLYGMPKIVVGENNTPWSIAISVPVRTIMQDAIVNFRISLIVGIIGILLMALVIAIISRNITNPITKITDLLKKIAKGHIDEEMKIKIE